MTSSFTSVDKQIAFAFLKYLDEVKASGKTTDESLDVAKDCLKAVFGIDPENAEDQKSYGISENLIDMFSNSKNSIENSKEFKEFVTKAKDKGYFGLLAEDSSEYKEKYETLLKKYTLAHSKSTKSSQEPPPPSSKSAVTPEKKAEADKYKEEGNQLLKANKYKDAYNSYTKAIETNSDGEGSHIYYSNRAAASMYLNNYDDAINDCKKALEIDPTFIRALTRLAKAYIYENKYVDAEECLERAKRLDSDNTEVKNLMNEVKEKKSSENGGSDAGTGSAPGGFPNIPNLDNLGGLGGLGDLLNNPAIRSVAENLMQNPDLMNMASSAMQNPNFLNMMSGMMNKNGGGGGGSNSGDSNQ